jgi:uncharacterized membrane protein HdeD (DUF308 family)
MRKGLITIGVLILILGLAALASGEVHSSVVFMIWGVALIAAIVFERTRYTRLLRQSPGPDWQRTSERFIDEETGKVVTVYIKPETGERAYVRD